jgi:cellulose synthase (UDP-forming)
MAAASGPAETPTVATAARARHPGNAPLITAGTSGTRHEHLTFKDLRIKTPIRLAGTRGEIGIPFGMRRNDVVTDAFITLRAAWSPALLGDLSQLVVLLNGEVVQTIPLRPGDRVARR